MMISHIYSKNTTYFIASLFVYFFHIHFKLVMVYGQISDNRCILKYGVS